MNILEFKVNNLEETREFGIKMGKLLEAGDIVCLNGQLGMGKTTMTKSIGLGLDVDEYITSPTFTLINEYKGRVQLYHFDVYRLENLEEVYDLGFDEYFFGNGVCIIEWAEKIDKIVPKERIVIDIEAGKDENERVFYISGFGQRYEEVLKELKGN